MLLPMLPGAVHAVTEKAIAICVQEFWLVSEAPSGTHILSIASPLYPNKTKRSVYDPDRKRRILVGDRAISGDV